MDKNFEKWFNDKKLQPVKDEAMRHDDLVKFINDMRSFLFPGYVDHVIKLDQYLDLKLNEIKEDLCILLSAINRITNSNIQYDDIMENFLNKLPEADELLKTDVQALFDGDPAAKSKDEIILTYPGFTAIFIYRIAHILYNLGVPILPRAISEYAHTKTGIDINPGAKIGSYFFIDHGTGIVIGETTEIGSHVKIYQGVTLGALSLGKGQKLAGVKRHPTVEDNVTIYSSASIFGGDTVIGKGSIIGSSTYITSSVEPNMIVTILGEKKKISK